MNRFKKSFVFLLTLLALALNTIGITSAHAETLTFTNITAIYGLGSNNVRGVYASGSTVYAATDGGLSISTDGGSTFTNKTTANGLGSNNIGGVYASGSTIYAATWGGLSISTDGGSTFTNKTTANGLGADTLYGVYVSDNTVYVATQDGGLSISTDGGSTFTNKTTANGLGADSLYGVYASGSTVYAATCCSGLSISTDGGNTFTTRTTADGLGYNAVFGVYASGSTVYAATMGGLSISTDGGNTFTNNVGSNGLGDSYINGVYGNGSTVYVATVGGLSISTDGGNTFTNKTTADGLGWSVVYGVYASGSTVYAATAGGISISTDGGTSFSTYAPTIGLGSNYVRGTYASGNTIYAATGNGLSISTDGGSTFTNKSTANGLGANLVNGVYASGNTVYAATWGGLSISTDGGNTFTNKTTADGLGWNVVFGVYASGSTVYAATDYGLSISTDGGSTFNNKTTANGLGHNWVNGVYASGSTVYAATKNGLSISIDGGSTFNNKTTADGLGNNQVNGVYASGSTVYASTWGGGLSISTNGGSTFTNRTYANGLANYLTGVYASGSTVYVAVYYDGLSISTDGGSTFTNTTTANGLGSNIVNEVYASDGTVYAATDGGLSISNVALTVTINQADGQNDPTTLSPINYTAVFNKPINASTFTSGDLTISGTAGATSVAPPVQISPFDGTTFNIAVSGMTNSGTVIASLDAGKVTDLAGNPNIPSTSTDNTVTYQLPTISGNAGTPGATLSYYDGTNKTATADGSGNYSFSVSYNWFGTVTPSKMGYTFTPASKSYTNLVADQAAQDYTAFIDPTYAWHTFFGSSVSDVGDAITTDGSGNIYIAGSSSATWNGPGAVAPLNAYAGAGDIVIVKLNSSGAYQWHTFYGSSDASDGSYAITSDTSGNIYLAGNSSATWSGPGSAAPLNAYVGASDIVIIKLNSMGTYQWHTFYGSTGWDYGKAIVSDASGIYVAGNSDETWNGPGAKAPLHAYAGTANTNIMVVKLDSAGIYKWHTFYGSYDDGLTIASDASGIYVAGTSGATWNGPGSIAPLNAYAGGGDIVILKLNSAGAYQWHTFYGSSSTNDYGFAITSDGSGIYVAGRSDAAWNGPGSTAPLNAHAGGTKEIVVVKLNSAGAYQWHTFHGSANSDMGTGITSDASGIYVAGLSFATWNGPGAAAPLNAFAGGYNIVVVKLNSAGIYQWHTFYGPLSLYYKPTITVNESRIYVAGRNDTTWNGPGSAAPLNAYAGGYDIMVVKMGNDTTRPSVIVEQASSQPDPTTRSPINFSVIFSKPINKSSFTDDDLTVYGAAGATTPHITGEISPYDGTAFNVAVSGMTTTGTVSLSLGAGKVTDLAGNTNTASTSADNIVNYIYERDNLCENVPALVFTQDSSGKLIANPKSGNLSASDDIDVFKFEASPAYMVLATLILPVNSDIDDFDFRLYQGCDNTDPDWNDGKRMALRIGVGGGNAGQSHTLVISRNIPNDLSGGSTFYLTIRKSNEGSYNPAPYQLNATLQPPNVGPIDPNDLDGDGLWNDWETHGYFAEDGTFVNLPAMGADPLHKDIFVEIDYMVAPDHSHQPKPDAMAKIVEAFNNAPVSNPDGKTGIHLHVDYGPESEMDPVTHAKWNALSGSNSLPHQDNLGYGSIDINDDYQYQWSTFNLIKNANFSKARATIFHYAVFAHRLSTEFGDISGIARDSGPSDFIVSLGGWTNNTGNVNEQAGTFMHELGHTLGLHHGGYDDIHYKPNFLSVMNYLFQTKGLIINGNAGNFDYSRSKLPTLIETMLNEAPGLGGNSSLNAYLTRYYCQARRWGSEDAIFYINNPIDWNCNGVNSEPNVQEDINGDGDMGSLIGFDDWFNLQYAGGSIGAFGALPEIPNQTTAFREITQAEDALLPSLYRVSIASSGNQTKSPGASTQITFTLKNTGGKDDTYTITASSSLGWASVVNAPSTIDLAAGASSAPIEIPVQVPAFALSGQVEKITITAVSQTNPNIEDQAIATVTVIDIAAPTVTSIVRANPSPTSAASVGFTVAFSEPVTNVDIADFRLTTSGVTGAAITGLTGSGATYTVTVKTGSGNGTIRLDVPVSATITDLAGNPLASLPYTGGQVYTVNKTLIFNSIGAQDGWILELGHNSKKGGTLNATAATFNLGDDRTRKQYRGILSFSTASLPDNATITGVTLKVMKQNIIGGGNPVTIFQGFLVDVKNGFFGTTAALQTGDFQAAAGKTVGPFSPALVSNWYSIDLTNGKAYINRLNTNSGLTQIRLRFKIDDNNNAVANYLSLFSGNAPAANRPQLVIQYYAP